MHDDPRDNATDPSDLTQRHAIPPTEPVPAVDPSAPEPVAESWTPTPAASGATVAAAGGDRYTPVPEARADWARTWDDAPPVTPERWYEPAPSPAPTAPATSEGRRGRSGNGSLVAATLLSAVLASGGTGLALGAFGGVG